MASIKNRNGSYLITVSMGRDVNGKQILETTTYKPEARTPKAIEKEVEQFARDFERQVREGKYYSGEKVTLADFIPAWEEGFLSQKTLSVREKYLGFLRSRFLPEIGNMKLAKIRSTHIDTILSEMKKEGRAPKTVRHAFTAINSIMRYAFKKGLIDENPCARCDDLPTVQRDGELHYFTLEQSKAFLRALDMEFPHKYSGRKRKDSNGDTYDVAEYVAHREIPLQYKVYFTLAIYGGFRRGELVALQWNDIDHENHIVHIRKSITKTQTAGQIVKLPKTKAGIRDVSLPPECFTLLRRWEREQRELSLTLGSAWLGTRGSDFEENYIFIRLDNGLRMDADTPSHKFKEIIEMYNETCTREEDKLPSIRLHDLRHTSATLLLAQNADIATVSHRLGHSKISTTLDVYTHALKSKDAEASDTIGKLFSGTI